MSIECLQICSTLSIDIMCFEKEILPHVYLSIQVNIERICRPSKDFNRRLWIASEYRWYNEFNLPIPFYQHDIIKILIASFFSLRGYVVPFPYEIKVALMPNGVQVFSVVSNKRPNKGLWELLLHYMKTSPRTRHSKGISSWTVYLLKFWVILLTALIWDRITFMCRYLHRVISMS